MLGRCGLSRGRTRCGHSFTDCCVLRLASTLFGRLISGRSLFLCSSPARWWRRWRRLRRRVWLQELHDLRVRTQLAIQQHQERFIQNLLVLRMLRSNTHLCHFRERQLLPDKRPLGQKVLDLLLDRRSPRRDGVEQQASGRFVIRNCHVCEGNARSLAISFLAKSLASSSRCFHRSTNPLLTICFCIPEMSLSPSLRVRKCITMGLASGLTPTSCICCFTLKTWFRS